VQWRREEGRCIPVFADWIVAPSLITFLFGNAKVSPTCSLQPVILFPISRCLPTPLFYISFDCRQGVLFANTSAHLFIYIQIDELSSLRFGRAVRRFTLSLSGWYLSLPIFFTNGAGTSASESHLIEYQLFKLLEASTNQQCKHKQISLFCTRQIICLS